MFKFLKNKKYHAKPVIRQRCHLKSRIQFSFHYQWLHVNIHTKTHKSPTKKAISLWSWYHTPTQRYISHHHGKQPERTSYLAFNHTVAETTSKDMTSSQVEMQRNNMNILDILFIHVHCISYEYIIY